LNPAFALSGRVVFWTGLKESGSAVLAAFEQQGAVAERHPLITCARTIDTDPFQHVTPDTWVVFTSGRAVEAVRDLPFPKAKIAVVGPSTESKLREIGIQVDLLPTVQNATGLADTIIRETADPGRVLFLRGDKALPTVAERLRAAGFEVMEQAVYRTTSVSPEAAGRIAEAILASADAVIFGSPTGVHALTAVAPLPAMRRQKPSLLFCALGPTTAAALVAAGIAQPIIAFSPSPEMVVRAVEAALVN
jgi:uroporphyrinogen-III synthase